MDGKKHLQIGINTWPVIILLIAAVLRFYALGQIPRGVTNDEAYYLYNAYSIWKTGCDLTGKLLPLSIRMDNSFPPVAIYLSAPVVGIFGLNATNGRLIFTMVSLGSIWLLYLITRRLNQDKSLATICMAVMAIMPWHIQMSRIAYDFNFALFFSMLGIYLMLGQYRVKYWLLSAGAFFLAFNSHHGLKLFIIPFAMVAAVIAWRTGNRYRQNLRPVLLFTGALIATLLLFLLQLKTDGISRSDVLVWNKMDRFNNTVNYERQKSTAPERLKPIFNNKVWSLAYAIREKYLTAYSPQFLFLYGETGGLTHIYGVSGRGMLYWTDMIFILGGLTVLVMKSKPRFKNLLLIWLILAPLPSALAADQSYGARCIMMIPAISVLTGLGLYSGLNILSTRFGKLIPAGICGAGYGILLASFLFQYFYRYPVYAAEAYHRSALDLALYLKNNTKKVLIADSGEFLIQYFFHNRTDPHLAQIAYLKNYPKTIAETTFITGCSAIKTASDMPKNTVYVVHGDCYPNIPPNYTISDQAEPLRIIWKIYEN